VSVPKVSGAAPKAPNRKVLGVFVLAMINVAAVLSLRNFPTMAEYGWELIFWVLLGTVFFLVPIRLSIRHHDRSG